MLKRKIKYIEDLSQTGVSVFAIFADFDFKFVSVIATDPNIYLKKEYCFIESGFVTRFSRCFLILLFMEWKEIFIVRT